MKKVLLTLIAPLCINAASAQILHHDVNPDTTMTNWNAFTTCFMGISHQSGSKYIDIWVHPTPEVVINTTSVEILHDAMGNYPAKLKENDTITPSGKWKPASYAPLNSAGMGNWKSDAADKYLAFRFTDSSQKMQYGWIKMSVAPGATSFTVKEWGHRPGKINAGQANTTSVQHIVDNSVEMINRYGTISFNGLAAGSSYLVVVVGADGRIARSASIQGNEAISIRGLATGMYVVRVTGNSVETNYKIAVLE